MKVVYPAQDFQPFDELPTDLDPEINPIVAAHFFGIDADNKSTKVPTTESPRTVRQWAA